MAIVVKVCGGDALASAPITEAERSISKFPPYVLAIDAMTMDKDRAIDFIAAYYASLMKR